MKPRRHGTFLRSLPQFLLLSIFSEGKFGRGSFSADVNPWTRYTPPKCKLNCSAFSPNENLGLCEAFQGKGAIIHIFGNFILFAASLIIIVIFYPVAFHYLSPFPNFKVINGVYSRCLPALFVHLFKTIPLSHFFLKLQQF